MDREKGKREIDMEALALESNLRNMKSFRTTFNLSIDTIQYISEKSIDFEISQKDLFDFMCNFVKSEPQKYTRKIESSKIGLNRDKKRKAYVISREARLILKEISSSYKIPRDDIVDAGFSHLKDILPVVKITHEDLIKVQAAITNTIEVAEKNEDALRILETDDPIRDEYGVSIITLYDALEAAERMLAEYTAPKIRRT